MRFVSLLDHLAETLFSPDLAAFFCPDLTELSKHAVGLTHNLVPPKAYEQNHDLLNSSSLNSSSTAYASSTWLIRWSCSSTFTACWRACKFRQSC